MIYIYIDEKFIKDRVVQLRTQKDISARNMSLSIGQNKNYINIIENCGNLPSMNGLILICEYFGITLKEFFDVDNKSPNDMQELMDKIKNLDVESIKGLVAFINGIEKNKK